MLFQVLPVGRVAALTCQFPFQPIYFTLSKKEYKSNHVTSSMKERYTPSWLATLEHCVSAATEAALHSLKVEKRCYHLYVTHKCAARKEVSHGYIPGIIENGTVGRPTKKETQALTPGVGCHYRL